MSDQNTKDAPSQIWILSHRSGRATENQLSELRRKLSEFEVDDANKGDPSNIRIHAYIDDPDHKVFVSYFLGENAAAQKSNRHKIQKPPAHTLVSIGRFVLSKATYQRYIEPHIQDIRLEHYEALQAGELHKARWIVIRGYCQALWPLAVAVWGTITALLKWST